MKAWRIYVVGAGKVGRALAAGLRKAGASVVLRAARRPLPRRRVACEVLVLAVRDGEIRRSAASWAGLLEEGTPVLHCAGALSTEPLTALAQLGFPVAQMHPCLAFAGGRRVPLWAGATMGIAGDPKAVAQARRIAKTLGMHPLSLEGVDRVLYHAAAALLANGVAALSGAARDVLVAAGVRAEAAPGVLAPLLASVAQNLGTQGLPELLTGPVRRGDAAAVSRHLDRLRESLPHLVGLYRELGAMQLAMARELAEVAGDGASEALSDQVTQKNYNVIARILEIE